MLSLWSTDLAQSRPPLQVIRACMCAHMKLMHIQVKQRSQICMLLQPQVVFVNLRPTFNQDLYAGDDVKAASLGDARAAGTTLGVLDEYILDLGGNWIEQVQAPACRCSARLQAGLHCKSRESMELEMWSTCGNQQYETCILCRR